MRSIETGEGVGGPREEVCQRREISEMRKKLRFLEQDQGRGAPLTIELIIFPEKGGGRQGGEGSSARVAFGAENCRADISQKKK